MKAEITPSDLAHKVKVYDAGGDIRKRWFIEFYAFNPQANEYQRLRVYKGINDHRNITDRKEPLKISLPSTSEG